VKVLLLSLALLAPVVPVRAEVSFMGYLQDSARRGEADSEFILGLVYRDGWDGTVKAGSTVARWCELAAELGDQRPGLVLGLLRREKNRVPRDGAAAVKCLTQAAGHGDNYAQVILGEMLLEGNGVPVNWSSGAEWMRKSAEAGFAPAQFRLGVIYLIGDAALPKNDIEALAWFIVAAQAGSKPAEEYRDKRMELLGSEAARLAIKRSRTLLGNDHHSAD